MELDSELVKAFLKGLDDVDYVLFVIGFLGLTLKDKNELSEVLDY